MVRPSRTVVCADVSSARMKRVAQPSLVVTQEIRVVPVSSTDCHACRLRTAVASGPKGELVDETHGVLAQRDVEHDLVVAECPSALSGSELAGRVAADQPYAALGEMEGGATLGGLSDRSSPCDERGHGVGSWSVKSDDRQRVVRAFPADLAMVGTRVGAPAGISGSSGIGSWLEVRCVRTRCRGQRRR